MFDFAVHSTLILFFALNYETWRILKLYFENPTFGDIMS